MLVLERVQVLIDQNDGVVQRFQLGEMIAIAVLAVDPLQVVQLGQQAFAQIARAHPDGVHLLHHVDGFAQGVAAERNARGRRCVEEPASDAARLQSRGAGHLSSGFD